MVVQAPELVQNPPQQSAQGWPNEHEAGQLAPVPVQLSPQLPEVLQLLPQQTNPSTHVLSSLQGQPKPAQPVAAAGAGVAIARPANMVAPRAVSVRSTERRDRAAENERVH
jgi:hypothetical protein